MNNRIITISREFGSGGRLVGERLAAKLGIAFYDRALIQLAAGKSGLDLRMFETAEEEARNKFLFNLAIGGYVSTESFSGVTIPISDQVFFAQSKVIEELAAKESCVIIGRCASYLLRNHPGIVRVFIHADRANRLYRIVNDYGVPENEAENRLSNMDKGRKNYYEHYTNEEWGATESYDLAINTGFTGIDGAVELIAVLTGLK